MTACPLPPRGSFGVAVQLYAARSRRSWGIGDFADLKKLARVFKKLGALSIHLNPLGAVAPGPQVACPYFASTRRYPNPLYLRIEELPEAENNPGAVEEGAMRSRALLARPLIDRDAVYALKLPVLRTLFRAGIAQRPAFEKARAAQGSSLEAFARFQSLAERFGPDYRSWPEEYRHPGSTAVERFARENPDDVTFYAWLVVRSQEQWRAAAKEIGLVTDLPVGFAPGGFDAWEWQDLLVPDMEIGCPPDDFNRDGQNWRLPPFDPHKLEQSDFLPLRQTLSALLGHARGIRIDHVMGLSRLFWVPSGQHPSKGSYVRYPLEGALGVISEAANKAGAFVIGEDLGTVEDGLRDILARQNILSSRLFWFEETRSSEWPALSAASVSSHDLPTVVGLYEGSDTLSSEHSALLAERWRRLGVEPGRTSAIDAVRTTYQELARAKSCLVMAAIDDLLAFPLRPNFPGTDHPENWCRALPMFIDDLERHPLVCELGALLGARRK